MSVNIRLKRRSAGGAAGAPSTLLQTEPAFNETDSTLYIGVGSGGSNGTATSIIPIAGPGAFVDRTSNQTISGTKAFNSIPTAPTPTAGDNSTNVATTAFVTQAQVPGPQSPNTVLAGPASGTTSSAPSYRALTASDIPTLSSAKISDFSTAADARISAQKGQANGLATLDTNGLIPAVQLPSYVDDVLEFASQSNFPATGETGKIYVAIDSKKIYRWSGQLYIELDPSPGSTDAVPEGGQNKYYTDQRVLNCVLVGLSVATNAVATASDSILVALGKLQAQVAARLVASNNLSDLASVSTARTNLGLGTMAVQNASAVAIQGGTIDGVTLDGGTV